MRTSLTLCVLVFTMVSGLPLASADDASEAQLQYELGVELYNRRRYGEALERFLASNRLVPNANVVFNITQVYKLLQRHRDAYNWLETYLRDYELDEEARARGVSERDGLLRRVAVIEVETSPPGADLFVDRIEVGAVGHSPRRIAVEAGERTIIARLDGYHDASRPIEAVQGSVVSLNLELTRRTGTLEVRGEPEGAQVFVEGQPAPLGESDLELELPIGEVRLVIRHPGYVDATLSVVVPEGGVGRARFALQREASTVAVLSVDGSPSGASVLLGGEEIGQTPLSLDALPPGSHELEVRSEGRESITTQLVLEAGAATRVSYELIDPNENVWPTWRWVAYVASAAVAVAGVGVALSARSARQSFFGEDNPTRDQA